MSICLAVRESGLKSKTIWTWCNRSFPSNATVRPVKEVTWDRTQATCHDCMGTRERLIGRFSHPDELTVTLA